MAAKLTEKGYSLKALPQRTKGKKQRALWF